MRNFIDDSIAEHNSRPPLRWIANWAGSMASKRLLRISYAEEYEENYGLRHKIDLFIWDNFWPIYQKYGTFYKLNMDMSGKEWDDYDENGVPYWEKWEDWDFEDEITGDAFRVIYK